MSRALTPATSGRRQAVQLGRSPPRFAETHMGKLSAIVATTALLAVLGCGGEPEPPKVEEPAPPEAKYQLRADRAKWNWDPKEASLLYCVRRDLRDFRVEIICPKDAEDKHRPEPMTVRLTDAGKEVYSFKAEEWTVFTRQGDVLYFAKFSPIAQGCSVVAYDFKAKKTLWKTGLKGAGAVVHSYYRNEVAIEAADDNAILVTGNETLGRYIEYVDMKSGETLGHKVFK
jgi:hypothetical protein